MMLIELVSDGRTATGAALSDTRWLGQQLVHLAKVDLALRGQIMQRYETIGTNSGRELIERTLEDIGDPDCVLALVRGHARSGLGFDGTLHQALRKAAHDERPAEGWAGAISMHPVELTALRKELFRMTTDGATASSIALEALKNIDWLRDHYGLAEFEPRHPDVETGRPWPPEAAT
jgi:hypothetical protein